MSTHKADGAGKAQIWLVGAGVGGFVLIALGAYLGSRNSAAHDAWIRLASISATAVGGALLAAVVVGVLIDRITRHRLSRETGEQWLWAVLGEDTPQKLRERAKEVISHSQVHLSVEFRCEMTWVDDDAKNLRLRVHVLADGVNHSRSSEYLPEGPAWAVSSVDEHKSRYRKWMFEAGDNAAATPVRRIMADPDLIKRHTDDKPPDRPDFEPDGSIFLDQDQLVKDLLALDDAPDRPAAAPRERFRLERELELILGEKDFFPYFIRLPTVNLKFIFSGDACAGLTMEARTESAQIHSSPGNSGTKVFIPEEALLPGHVIIFSWQPRNERQEDKEAGLDQKRLEELEEPDAQEPATAPA